MKSTNKRNHTLRAIIRNALTRRRYTVSIISCGTVMHFEIEAPDYRRALEEAETLADDCGWVTECAEVQP